MLSRLLNNPKDAPKFWLTLRASILPVLAPPLFLGPGGGILVSLCGCVAFAVRDNLEGVQYGGNRGA